MDAVVVGAGVVGLATTAALLDAGVNVTCCEARAPMSQRSAGGSRIFRLAHGLPELVAFAARAHHGYRRWQAHAGAVLVDPVGACYAGPDAPRWAQAMSAAGAQVEVVESHDAARQLPVRRLTGPVIADPVGGVIDAHRTGVFLTGTVGAALIRDRVHALELTGTGVRVRSERGWRSYDAAIVVAGAGTAALAAQVGIEVPDVRAHHARFTFRLTDPAARPACLLERSESWRQGITFYHHLAAPGQWAVGVDLPPELRAWPLGRAAVVETSRQITISYVRECLRGVGDDPIGEVSCDLIEGWGDGYVIQRAGPVLVLHGGNLFKLAAALGQLLAEAVHSGDTPPAMHDPDLRAGT
jgi:glycine/D-amino acid oxidase-like deaminating enzyme